MMRIEKISKLVSAMAFSRLDFNAALRGEFKGAFGEFMCRQIAIAVGRPDNWSEEVERILLNVKTLMNSEQTKTTFSKREKVLQESMLEAITHTQVTYAKNKVAKYYPKLLKKIDSLNFDAKEEFAKMLQEFLPEYANLLEGNSK